MVTVGGGRWHIVNMTSEETKPERSAPKRSPEEIEERLKRIREAVERFRRAHKGPFLTDADMYDDQGLPSGNSDFSKTDIEPAIRPKR